jgi:protein-disulfide isomerase
MPTQKKSGKLALFALVALVGAAAGYGYYSQATQLSKTSKSSPKSEKEQKIERAELAVKPNDIVMGDVNALVTIVEYSSLSCPHCAHFHEKILPAIDKEFLTTGKAKLVIRHFPLNEPAMRAAQIVECAGQNNLKRESFLKVFFNMQPQWAFGESFLKDLKQIAFVGGMDSAAFDSCVANSEIEAQLLNTRKEAEEKLHVTSTPSFFINGLKFDGDMSVDGMRTAINTAIEPTK